MPTSMCAVGVVGERVEELLAAAPTLRVEQQDRSVGELAAELAAVGTELLDDPLVPLVEFVGFHVFSLDGDGQVLIAFNHRYLAEQVIGGNHRGLHRVSSRQLLLDL